MSSPVPEPDDPTPIDPVNDPPIDPQNDDGSERVTRNAHEGSGGEGNG